MVLHHIKRGVNLGIRHMEMNAKQVEAELKPIVKAGLVTAKDAKVFAAEIAKVGKKNKELIEDHIVTEAHAIIKAMGYVEREEFEALKKRFAKVSDVYRKAKSSKRAKKPKARPKTKKPSKKAKRRK